MDHLVQRLILYLLLTTDMDVFELLRLRPLFLLMSKVHGGGGYTGWEIVLWIDDTLVQTHTSGFDKCFVSLYFQLCALFRTDHARRFWQTSLYSTLSTLLHLLMLRTSSSSRGWSAWAWCRYRSLEIQLNSDVRISVKCVGKDNINSDYNTAKCRFRDLMKTFLRAIDSSWCAQSPAWFRWCMAFREPQPLTLRSLMDVLRHFSEVGSNQRRLEEDVYRVFHTYLREVVGEYCWLRMHCFELDGIDPSQPSQSGAHRGYAVLGMSVCNLCYRFYLQRAGEATWPWGSFRNLWPVLRRCRHCRTLTRRRLPSRKGWSLTCPEQTPASTGCACPWLACPRKTSSRNSIWHFARRFSEWASCMQHIELHQIWPNIPFPALYRNQN